MIKIEFDKLQYVCSREEIELIKEWKEKSDKYDNLVKISTTLEKK